MDGNTLCPVFSYEPLQDNAKFIRLLKVIGSDEEGDVQCQLSTYSVTEAPSYYAISYTWGDKNPPSFVRINGKSMRIRPNCLQVLRQAWHYRKRGLYWIDAICINQTNADEKGFQVDMMGSIFHRAERVLACTGDHGSDSDYLYRTLRWNAAMFGRVGRLDDISAVGWKEKYDWWLRLWRLQHGALATVRLYRAFAAFLRRAYFSRVWIYQELFLGTRVGICCQGDIMPAHRLHGLAGAILHWESAHSSSASLLREPDRRVLQEALPLLKAGALPPQKKVRLAWLMQYVTHLSCEDPKDKVYGVLSIVDWRGKTPIRPDYKRDRLDLAVEVLKIIKLDGYPYRSWIAVGREVIQNLQLNRQPFEARLNQVLHERHLVEPGPGTGPQDLASDSKIPFDARYTNHTFFMGFRLGCGNGESLWQLETPTGNTVEERHVAAVYQWPCLPTKTHKVQIGGTMVLPRQAQVGDWCLLGRHADPGISSLVLIARKRDARRFWIVGKGLVYLDQWPLRIPAASYSLFNVFLDEEDAVAVMSSFDLEVDFRRTPESQLSLYLDTRVCGRAGSSFALSTDVVGGRGRDGHLSGEWYDFLLSRTFLICICMQIMVC